MHLTISKSELLNVLSVAASIVSKKTTVPILANILFNASKGKLTLTSSDLDVTFIYESKAVVQEPGATTINTKVLYDIVKELSDAPISLKLKNQERLELLSGSARMNIICNSAVEYPIVTPTELGLFAKIKASVFSEMIAKTIYAVSNDTSRFILNGILLESSSNNNLSLVTTDGNRLSLITREVTGAKEGTKLVVSSRNMSELKKVLDLAGDEIIEFGMYDQMLVVKTSSMLLMLRLLDGSFPEYKNLIPNKTEQVIKVNSQALSSAVRRLSVINSDKSHAIKFDFTKDSLKLYNSSANLGDGYEEVEISLTGNDFSVGLNSKFVIDFCNSIAPLETIQLDLNSKHGAVKMSPATDNGYLNIVMPMRIIDGN